MAKNQLSVPNYMKKVSFHKILFIKLAKQVIQTRNFGILFLFFQLFAHFGLFTDPLTNCKVQKSIQLPKLHGKSVISLNKFHKIWENSTKIVKNGQKLPMAYINKYRKYHFFQKWPNEKNIVLMVFYYLICVHTRNLSPHTGAFFYS